MTDEPIIPIFTAQHETSRGVAVPLGGQTIKTPHGTVSMNDAPGFSTLLISHEDSDFSRIGLLIYAPAEPCGVGLLAQIDATQARTFAASLLRLAAVLDPSKPN
jgi:hypothetical protein